MEREKIAFVVYDISVMGGAERVTVNMANELIKYYDIYIISILNKNGKNAYELNSQIKVSYLFQNKTYRLRSLLIKIRKKLISQLKGNNIQKVLCIGNYTGMLVPINLLGTRIHTVFCDHSSVANQLKNRKIILFKYMASKLSKFTVVLTDKSLDDYRKIFKTPRKKLIRIYNWIDDDALKKAAEYKTESNNIITVGRISPEKGFDMLVEVAKELRELNDNWQWDIYGYGEDFNKIQAKIKEYDLASNVFMKGNSNCIYDLYKEYSIYVLTSYREGLPMVLLEAKANKLPIVSFDIETGPNEIIKNNENGFLIKPYDIKEMAKKIDTLLRDKNKRCDFSKKSQIDIEKFNKKTIINEWINFIKKM